MEPLPESREAADELDPVAHDALVLDRLEVTAERVRELVPDLVGISLASVKDGITITVVATEEECRLLDGVQYVAGGPCVSAAAEGTVRTFEIGVPLEESSWQLFAQAAPEARVASTLSLPILADDGRVVGSVNLYGATSRAFDGLHEPVAELFSAWAPGAVTNADLSFSTLEEARDAPRRVHERNRIETAVGLLAAQQGIDLDRAARRLQTAAVHAQVSVYELAEAVIEAASGGIAHDD
ncbi:ANTAR domain-containing protein [Nocardioides sp. SYSU D00038]|uniref:ANTAR domain-containing protein n=1 Tax=Nocardioides sp. SYSU D00038 TaxID=2812554 RepID=UPI0019673051|nr:ANTAR domain-containing protein [Nocardioides sp. SYSU D00038]